MTTAPTPVDVAFALLREGRLVDAENVMARELQTATERHGAGSPAWASAQCDLGNVLLTYSPKILRGGRIAAEWTHVGRYYTNPQNTQSYAGHELFTLHANVMLPGKTELFARVLNVTDRNFAEVVSWDASQGQQFTPGLPRVVYAGVRVGR